MITPRQMNLFSSPVAEMYQALELEIIKQVATRLKVKGEVDITDWQLQKMKELNLLNRDLSTYLSKFSEIAKEEIDNYVNVSGHDLIEDTDEFFKANGYVQAGPSNITDRVLESYSNQMFRELDNHVNQTLITTNYGTGPVTAKYQKLIGEVQAKYSTGLITLDKAVEQTVTQWAKDGIKSTFIDKGGHAWSLERYVDTVLKSTNARIYNDIRTNRMSDYGCTTVRVSQKANARPECAHIQGRVVDISRERLNVDYPNVYDYEYGKPGGHRGVNCGHFWVPFIPGVNIEREPMFPPETAIENAKVEAGRKLLARRIRKTKKMVSVTEALGSEGQSYYNDQLKRQQARMREYVKEHNLTRIYRFEKVYTPLETLLKEYKEQAND